MLVLESVKAGTIPADSSSRSLTTATSEGKLGPTSEAAVYIKQNPETTVIRIHSQEFSNADDVHRVLDELVNLIVRFAECKRVYYKCDAPIHPRTFSSNSYKLRASLYSSKDILGLENKATAVAPSSRPNKRDREMADILPMFSDNISQEHDILLALLHILQRFPTMTEKRFCYRHVGI